MLTELKKKTINCAACFVIWHFAKLKPRVFKPVVCRQKEKKNLYIKETDHIRNRIRYNTVFM